MSKGQKILTALAVSPLFAVPAYATDEGFGETHFKGEVTEASCEVHPEDTDENINLGRATITYVNRKHHSNKVAVNTRLISCDLPTPDNGSGMLISKVDVTFDSAAKIIGATPLLNNTNAGEATGAGIRLTDKSDGNIVLGSAVPDLDLDASPPEQTLSFFAWMEQIGNAVDVTTGEVIANAAYVLDYK